MRELNPSAAISVMRGGDIVFDARHGKSLLVTTEEVTGKGGRGQPQCVRGMCLHVYPSKGGQGMVLSGTGGGGGVGRRSSRGLLGTCLVQSLNPPQLCCHTSLLNHW